MAKANNKGGVSACPAFAAIRLKAATERAYYAPIIFSMIPVESDKVPTLAVDKYWRMYYNPNLLNILPIEESIALFIHEVGHLIREHSDRQGNRDNYLWNLAGDFTINVDIKADNMSLPDGCMLPTMEQFKLKDGMTTEQYYDELWKKAKKIKIPTMGRGTGKGGCGSCAGNEPGEWEEKDGHGGKELTDKDGNPVPKVDKLTQELARRSTASKILEHSKSRGTVPDGLLRWAKDKLVSKVDWRKEIRTAITNSYNRYIAGMADYTRSRFSRRQSAYGDVMMYGFHAPVPNIAVIIDTSGSMSDTDLGQAIAEVGKVLKTFRSDVTVLSCDAAVGNVSKISAINQIKLTGGGGTDMPVGFEKASELKPKPDICICITDGYTPWPSHKYDFKTFAVLTRKEQYDSIPKWIKVLPAYVTEIEEEKE
jgi:predicted metal-dependent peptidase